jgi:DHA1 family tetracycline resistance protein-like MFS transporter
MALGNGLYMAFNSSLVSRVTPSKIQGEALGINSSVMALAQAIPAVIAGYVASFNDQMPLIVGSSLIAFGGVLFWVLFKPGRDDRYAATSGAEIKD